MKISVLILNRLYINKVLSSNIINCTGSRFVYLMMLPPVPRQTIYPGGYPSLFASELCTSRSISRTSHFRDERTGAAALKGLDLWCCPVYRGL